MSTADPLDGRRLMIKLVLVVNPPPGAKVGHTDAAFSLAQRIHLEAGLLARRLCGEQCTVETDRSITVI